MSDIEFPAIAVRPGDSFYVTSRLPTQATTVALRSGYFDRLYFFDSAGLLHRVARVRAEPTFLDSLLSRRVSVSLELGDATPGALVDVIRDLCALIDADPDDVYDQHVPPTELTARIRNATSPTELIRLAERLGAPA